MLISKKAKDILSQRCKDIDLYRFYSKGYKQAIRFILPHRKDLLDGMLELFAADGELELLKEFIPLSDQLKPSLIACSLEREDLITFNYLRELGVPCDENAIFWAACTGKLEVLKGLVSEGVPVHIEALEQAINAQQIGVIEYLLSIGVGISEVSILWAREDGNREILDLITRYAPNISWSDAASTILSDPESENIELDLI